jgi:hypothetical protein
MPSIPRFFHPRIMRTLCFCFSPLWPWWWWLKYDFGENGKNVKNTGNSRSMCEYKTTAHKRRFSRAHTSITRRGCRTDVVENEGNRAEQWGYCMSVQVIRCRTERRKGSREINCQALYIYIPTADYNLQLYVRECQIAQALKIGGRINEKARTTLWGDVVKCHAFTCCLCIRFLCVFPLYVHTFAGGCWSACLTCICSNSALCIEDSP